MYPSVCIYINHFICHLHLHIYLHMSICPSGQSNICSPVVSDFLLLVHIFIFFSNYTFIHLSIQMTICQRSNSFIYLLISVSVRKSIWPSVNVVVRTPHFFNIRICIYLYFCLRMRLSICLYLSTLKLNFFL